MKKILVWMLFLLVGYSHATANIGITSLFYSSDATFINKPQINTPKESKLIPLMAKFNQMVINKMEVRLAGFPIALQHTLTESGSFHVLNVESTIIAWNLANPKLISDWERESVSKTTEDAAAEKIESHSVGKKQLTTQVKPHNYMDDRYILIGWVTSIRANEIRQPFPQTNKTSVLYNLNIEVKYKIIDYETKEVITQFIAAGHGGTAIIVPTNITKVVANANDISEDAISNTIDSLLFSVKHGLLVKQDMGLLPK